MKSKNVIYDCLLLSEDAKIIATALATTYFGEKISENDMKIVELMHCTLRYMGGKRNQHKREFQLCNEELHQKASICVCGVGIYEKDGVLCNVGLLVDKDKSILPEQINIDRNILFDNPISHITIMVNNSDVAKASETEKCFEDGVGKYVLFLDRYLQATVEAVAGGPVIVDYLEDYPELRKESKH